jgi:hypothetical protein
MKLRQGFVSNSSSSSFLIASPAKLGKPAHLVPKEEYDNMYLTPNEMSMVPDSWGLYEVSMENDGVEDFERFLKCLHKAGLINFVKGIE